MPQVKDLSSSSETEVLSRERLQTRALRNQQDGGGHLTYMAVSELQNGKSLKLWRSCGNTIAASPVDVTFTRPTTPSSNLLVRSLSTRCISRAA
ncbi:jg21315 [Pararge aegeria aegeria]|uniref:Jg21315 protein n=1 Tax=Pararge aegeria aegeria TaxID=348720 RepID=A0A8S4QTE0_9NEOP|nr:jg21315 [Pararge aegeria aegeria]